MAPPGVTFALALNVVLILATMVAVAYWRRRVVSGRAGTATDPAAAWYEEAASLAREAVAMESDLEAPVDRNRLRRRALPLSERIKSHARRAPERVEASLLREFHELGVECNALAVEEGFGEVTLSGVFVEDRPADFAASGEAFAQDAEARATTE